MRSPSIEVIAKTDIGKERNSNEDSIVSAVFNIGGNNQTIDCGILAVADGMGGHELGEVASSIATKVFLREVLDRLLEASIRNTKINFLNILGDAFEVANQEVLMIRKGTRQMGTTLVGAIICNNNIYIANVGDSRAYIINPEKELFQITKDHSAVQEMLDANIITKEQARNHPRKNIITKALGLNEDAHPDFFETTLNNQMLMLCSDGLSNMIEEIEIVKRAHKNLESSVNDLINLANKRGGTDNISIALACYN